VPKKAVALAALLLTAGTSLLIAALALGAQGTQHATPLFVLGAVMFLPVRHAALAGVAALRRSAWHKRVLTPPPSPCACALALAGRLLHALGIQGVAGRGGLQLRRSAFAVNM
jgi:predicted membrane protein